MSDIKHTHGGARPGAGRPKGSGKYKEPTKAIRVPESSVTYIKEFLTGYPDVIEFGHAAPSHTSVPDQGNNVHRLEIPLFSSRVAAGIPSPAEDHVEHTLD